MKKPLNDVIDFHRAGGEMTALLDDSHDVAMSTETEAAIDDGSRFETLAEILARPDVDDTKLIDGLVPRDCVMAIVGAPDTGKSQLARQMAAAVVSDTTFLGLRIDARHRRSLVVVTEETEADIRFGARRQQRAAARYAPERVSILIAADLSPDEVLQAVDDELQREPADLVVVDSFGDVYPGRDQNSTAEMRAALKPWAALAKRRSVTVLFVNHLLGSGIYCNISETV